MTYLSSQQSDEQADSPVSSSSADGDSTLGEKKETAKLHLHITITKAKSHKKATSSLLTLGPTSTAGLAAVDRGSWWAPAGVIPGRGVMGAQRSSCSITEVKSWVLQEL